jgi:RNA polymerase sigma-70 factor (ECF subfamily)
MDSYEIYDQYYQRVKRFILSYVRDEWTADDLTQETFIRIQRSHDTVKDASKLSSWIFRIAYNLCRDHFRSRKLISSRECEISESMEGFKEAMVQKELEQCEMGECVQSVVRLLPEPLRSVIILFDMGELSHREIAEILDITVENVKVRLHRGRKRLKALLEERCTFEIDERNVLICEPLNLTREKGDET